MQPVFLGLSLIDWAVVAGIALVVPLGLLTSWRWAALVAATALVSHRCGRGTLPAVVLALPWVVTALAPALGTTRRVIGHRGWWPLRWEPDDVVALAGHGLVAVASGWALASRAGVEPFGVGEPIVQLTAVHFTYLGAGALPMAGAALASAGMGRAHLLGVFAVALTVGAPPFVAMGFLTGWAAPQVGGAGVMTLGVWATATLELRRALRGGGTGLVRVCLAVSGLSVWVPMVLAVAWAAGQHWDVPALSIPDMVRTHGAVNAVGFVGAGLLALHLGARRGTLARSGEPEEAATR